MLETDSDTIQAMLQSSRPPSNVRTSKLHMAVGSVLGVVCLLSMICFFGGGELKTALQENAQCQLAHFLTDAGGVRKAADEMFVANRITSAILL